MFHFIKYSLRKIFKQKTISFINLTGLVLGISTFLFIALWIRSELSFDRFWKENKQIYRVALTKTVNGAPVLNTAMNYPGAGMVLQNELPEIETATTFGKDHITAFTNENSFQDINFSYIDTSFFKVFPRPMIYENPNIFSDIHGAILSKSMAKNLFGNSNPLNQKFKLNEGWEFFVSAVFEDFPENSHLKIDMMVQWKSLFYYMGNFNYTTGVLDNSHISEITQSDPYSQREWSYLYSYTYIKLRSEKYRISDLESKYKKAVQPCIKHLNEAGEDVQFSFQPVSSIHLFSKLSDEFSVNGSSFRLQAFVVIGLLILIISWFNYINLSIADQMKQTVKNQVKRIIGAGKDHLFLQQFSETFLIHAFAGLASVLLLITILKSGIYLSGFSIYSLNYVWLIFICLILVLSGTLISSLFPFFRILGVTSSITSRNSAQTGSRRFSFRQALVILQFGIAIILIICTGAVFKQIWYMQKQDLGANLNQVLISYSPMTMIKKPSLTTKLKAFQDEISRIPGVVTFATAETVPGKNFRRSSNRVNLDNGQENKYQFSLAHVDQNYFDLFEIKLLAGSYFLSSSDYNNNNVVINARASKLLGINDPRQAVDRIIYINSQPNRIIGVIDDYHHLSLKDEIAPTIFSKSLNWYFDVGYYCIKVKQANLKTTIHEISNVWNNVYPGEPYLYSFLDDTFNDLYQEDKKFGSTYLFFAIIAIFIASMGLFALARLSAESKIKEIGIRKVNGARVAEVMIMLNKDFLRWVAIAFFIACPLAWFAMYKWLENFAYKTALSWWVFMAAGGIALIIALFTVSWQSWRAATRNPVESLRYE